MILQSDIKKAQDTGNKVVDSATGLEFVIPYGEYIAPEVDKGLGNVPEGFAVIVLAYGDQHGDMYPQPVSNGGEVWWVPRGTRRAIPMNHLSTLLDCKEKRLMQPRPGVAGFEYEANRFDVQVLKLPEASGKDIKNKIDTMKEKAERQQIHIS